MAIKNPFRRNLSDETPTKSELTTEIGFAGDLVFTGFKDEEQRTDNITIEDYRKMIDNDPTVEALFNVFRMSILANTYRIDADANDTSDTQADFVRKNLLEPPHKGGMDTPMDLFLDQNLQAIYEGFSLFEIIYKLTEERKYVISRLAHRDSTTLTLKRDDEGGYGGATQRVNYDNTYHEVSLPAYKTFLFTYGKSRSFLYGRSAFKSLYPKYDKKRRLEYLDSISLQNDAIKAKVLKRTTDKVLGKNGKSLVNKALAALSKLGETKPVASLPYGFDVDVISSEGRSPHESIERQNSEMARAFHAQIVLMATQGGSNVGSYSLSTNQKDLLYMAITSVTGILEAHINQYLIAPLIDLNFAERNYPEFHFNDPDDDVVSAVFDAFKLFIQKDKVSDDMAKGIEEATASRLDIDLDAIRKQREKAEKKAEKEAHDDSDDDEPNGNGPQLSDISSRNFPGLYDGLVDDKNLGCIMLDLQTFDVRPHVDDADADLYVSDEAHSGGAIAETEAHVTLLYGLLQNGNTIKDKVDKVLEGLNIESVVINDVGSFEVDADAPSVPIVAFVNSNSSRGLYYDGDNRLKQAHDRLALLPHINTFGDYQPHVTLAYVKNDPDIVQKWVKALGDKLRGMRLGVTGLNYGDLPEDDDKGGQAGSSGGGFLGDHSEHDHKERELADGMKWWRALTPAEERIRLEDLNAKMDTFEESFQESADKILKHYLQDLVESGVATAKPDEISIELPADYVKLITTTVQSAYNYAKTGAADELGVQAPATSKEAVAGIKELTEFIVNKQQDDISSIIATERLQQSPQLADGDVEEEAARKAAILAALTAWLAIVLRPTASSIVSRGVNNGRDDVFVRIFQEGDVYQYSAILDSKVCPICESLDGKVITPAEYAVTRWKPQIHFNCRCLYVLIRKLVPGKTDTEVPNVTGFDNETTQKIYDLITTRKQELIDAGLIDENSSKIQAARQLLQK